MSSIHTLVDVDLYLLSSSVDEVDVNKYESQLPYTQYSAQDV